MKKLFTQELHPEVFELESEDGKAYAVLAEDQETLVGLFPWEDVAGGETTAFHNAFLFLTAPKLLEIIEDIAEGRADKDIQKECRAVLEMFTRMASEDGSQG
jgi:hypothetical protein